MSDARAPRLLLLIPTTSYRAGDFLDAAHRLGVEVAVGSDRDSVLAKFSDGRTTQVAFADPERAVAQIEAYAAAYPLAAIVGVDEGTTTIAARASQRLGLPHNDPGAVAAASNKYRTREALSAAGLPQPMYRLFRADEDPPAAARRINNYPVVLKPLALSASRGVIRADDAEGFADAFTRIRRILDETAADTGLRAEPYVLAEDYMPGGEVALEGLLIGGRLHTLALFDKPDPMEGPTFEETIFVTPSRLPANTQALIRARTEAAIAALGLSDGPVHAELRLHPQEGPVPLEIAARSIGGLCARSLRFGTGIGLEELIIQHALGRPPASLERERRPAGVMMLPVPGAGRLVEVRGEAKARAVPGIVDLRITVAPGTPIRPLPEGDRYLGFIFATADSPNTVEAALRQAAGCLEPKLEAHDGVEFRPS
ncbi:ATP-grasp domain-containing protein [Ferruginivarius sediminum]|uniref:ATP-grasp domain-containing protein n=2 Tax=Ferruginivarius sediminum TaxID=2661937 RepID=A0A369TAY8_9PROT|nr:ATP-grasp domain-containing protein [Ferruginivarius sediminum]